MKLKYLLLLILLGLIDIKPLYSQYRGKILLKTGKMIVGFFIKDKIDGQEVYRFEDENGNLIIGEEPDLEYTVDDIAFITQEESEETGTSALFEIVGGAQALPTYLLKTIIMEEIKMIEGAFKIADIQGNYGGPTNFGRMGGIIKKEELLYRMSFLLEAYSKSGKFTHFFLSFFDKTPKYFSSNYLGKVKISIIFAMRTSKGSSFLGQVNTDWNKLTRGNKFLVNIPSEKAEQLKKDNLEVFIMVHDNNFWGKIKENIGFVQLKDADLVFMPPKPNNVTGDYGYGEVTLNWTNEPFALFDHVNVYRSHHSNFITDESTYIGSTSGEAFKDSNVKLGEIYYYILRTVDNEGNMGNKTEVFKIIPKIRLEPTVQIHKEEIYPCEPIQVTGKVITNEGDPVADASIQLKIKELNYHALTVPSNTDGKYEGMFYAPAVPGNFTLLSASSKGALSAKRELSFNVLRNRNLGHDPSVSGSEIPELIVEPGNDLEINYNVLNQGRFNENIPITHFILDQNLNTIQSIDEEFNLTKGETRQLTENITIDPDRNEGIYHYKAEIGSDTILDEMFGNNQTFRTFYVKELPAQQDYKLSEYILQKGESVNVAGKDVVFRNAYGSVIEFNVNGATNNLDLNEFWLSDDEELMCYPSLNIGDTIVHFQGGGLTNMVSATPTEDFIKIGSEAYYEISYPSSGQINDNDIELYNYNATSEITHWSYDADYISAKNHIRLNVELPDANPSEYGYFVKAVDDDYWWMTKLDLRTIPIHDIRLSDYSFVNNVQDYGGVHIPGDDFNIRLKISNNSNYYKEAFPVQMMITNKDTLIYSEARNLSLNEKSSEYITFHWRTTGLPEGNYDIEIFAKKRDHDLSDNQITDSRFLDGSPKLTLSVKKDSSVYERKDTIPIAAKVNYNNAIVKGADVSGILKRPGQEEEEINLNWNGQEQIYETSIVPHLGGFYEVILDASKRRYIEDLDTAEYKVLTNLSFEISDDTINRGNGLSVKVKSTPTGNLQGISFDLVYNPDQVKVENVLGSGYLSENKTIKTSRLLKHNQDGRTIFGLTRLDSDMKGISSFYNENLAGILIKGLSEGNARINIENCGVISADGKNIPVSANNISFDIEDKPVNVILEEDSIKLSVSDTGDLDLFFLDMNNLGATYGELSFNPEVVEVLNIKEQNLFNEKHRVKTNFITDINNREGVAKFGITRTSSSMGLNEAIGEVLSVKYQAIKKGFSRFQLNDIQLIDPQAEVNYSSNVHTDSIYVYPKTAYDTAQLFFSPSSYVVGLDSICNIDLNISDVNNLSSFAADLYYNPQIIKIKDLKEGNFLNENGVSQTTFNYDIDSINGQIIIGLSRLDSGTVSSAKDTSTLLTIEFIKKVSDSTSFKLSNVGLIAPEPNTLYPVEYDTALIVDDFYPVLLNSFRDIVYNEGFERDTIYMNNYFNDPGGDLFCYSVLNKDPSAVEVSFGNDSLFIHEVGVGEDSIVIMAMDTKGRTAKGEFLLSVNAADNHLPVIKNPIEDCTYSEGFVSDTIYLNDFFSDPDDDLLTYSVKTKYSSVVNVEISEDSLFIQEILPGEDTITVTAKDGNGGIKNYEFKVTVNASENHIPVVENPIGDLIYNKGFEKDTIYLNLVFYDEDSDLLTYTVIDEQSAVKANISGDSLFIYELGTGVDSMSVIAKDIEGGEAKDDFKILVNGSPYVISTISDQTFEESFSSFDLDLSGVFEDDGKALTYEVSSEDPAIVSTSVADTILTLHEEGTGNTRIIVTATDEYDATATDDFEVEVKQSTGIIRLGAREILIYPNPTRDDIFIEGDLDNVFITLMNMQGQVLHREQVHGSTKKVLHLNDEPKGLYLLKLYYKTHQRSIKIIKD